MHTPESNYRCLLHRPARKRWLMVEQGLTSHWTQFRSFRRRCFFFQVRWPNQQCQSTEGGWL